jgi:biopolymer transport protein ExbB
MQNANADRPSAAGADRRLSHPLAGIAAALMLAVAAPLPVAAQTTGAGEESTPPAAETLPAFPAAAPAPAQDAPSAQAAEPAPAAAPQEASEPSAATTDVSEPGEVDSSVPSADPSAGTAGRDEQAPDATAVIEPAPGQDAERGIEAEGLPRDLSPWNMFMSADLVVKAVMIGLIFASVVTWTVWLSKSIEIAAAKRKVGRALRAIVQAHSLDEAASLMGQRKGVGPALVGAAGGELRSWNGADKASVKERIGSHLDRIEHAAARDINKGTGILATIGATAPFVGLFGTVWGIMNSFIGISEAQTTNLAIVAPGIAEALLATAFGLVAAIPAVIFYNQLARSIGGYKAIVADGAAAVARLASRELDKGGRVELRAAE